MITPATIRQIPQPTPQAPAAPRTDSFQRTSEDLEFSEYGRLEHGHSVTAWVLATVFVVLILLATAA